MYRVTIGFALALSLFASCETPPPGNDQDLPWSQSAISGPPYKDVISHLRELEKNFTGMAKVQGYGKSVRGQDLIALVVGKPASEKKMRSAVVITGGVHGTEYLSVEDRLPEQLLLRSRETSSTHRYLDSGGVLIFVPVVNPDGYALRSRLNAHQVDLNRDWKEPKEPETKALRDFFHHVQGEMDLNFRVMVDYHCCAAAILYPWSRTIQSIPQHDLEKHLAVAQLAQTHLHVRPGTTAQVLAYYPSGTSKDYYYDTFRALAFTFEGHPEGEGKQLSQHVAWWESIFDYLAQK